jgi:hypothetical protein
MRKNRWAGRAIKNCKKRGEWVELVFAVRAMELGLSLARPWGESSGYDFMVDQGERIVRVQVKSTIFKEGEEGYSCSLKDSKGPYKKGSFEYVAAYVIPEDVWFILPEKIIRGMWSVGLYPKLETAKYREYQEAWHLLRGETLAETIEIQAFAEEPVPGPRFSAINHAGWAAPFVLAAHFLRWKFGGTVSSRFIRTSSSTLRLPEGLRGEPAGRGYSAN